MSLNKLLVNLCPFSTIHRITILFGSSNKIDEANCFFAFIIEFFQYSLELVHYLSGRCLFTIQEY